MELFGFTTNQQIKGNVVHAAAKIGVHPVPYSKEGLNEFTVLTP